MDFSVKYVHTSYTVTFTPRILGSRPARYLAEKSLCCHPRNKRNFIQGMELGYYRLPRFVIFWLGFSLELTYSKGKDLAFTVSDRTAFELSLENVVNANIAGKTEVSLEFATPSKKPPGDEMTEIRFYVPGTHSKLKGSDAGSNKSDVEDNEDDDEEEVSAAHVFHEQIKERSGTAEMTGKLILSFEEVLVLTPRGRYDMDMGPDFLRLRGKT